MKSLATILTMILALSLASCGTLKTASRCLFDRTHSLECS